MPLAAHRSPPPAARRPVHSQGSEGCWGEARERPGCSAGSAPTGACGIRTAALRRAPPSSDAAPPPACTTRGRAAPAAGSAPGRLPPASRAGPWGRQWRAGGGAGVGAEPASLTVSYMSAAGTGAGDWAGKGLRTTEPGVVRAAGPGGAAGGQGRRATLRTGQAPHAFQSRISPVTTDTLMIGHTDPPTSRVH